ncbi:MAG: BlaI/MecI/CopY family transcriptional regulator [Oscillospiraceae bacterium]|nr:BlaI/MecI/CopY family transcriptional regulator [Oscillospiraceae bacterium]
MQKIKKLPDAEFEIMKVVWANEPPITTSLIMQKLGNEKEWLIQSVVTLMSRLVDRGFLRTEKAGKERFYYPTVERKAYLKFETGMFIKQYHENSFINLVNTLNEDKALSDKDIDDLFKWVQERKG